MTISWHFIEVYSYIVKPDFPKLFFTSIVFYFYIYSGYTSAYVQHMSLTGGAELERGCGCKHDTVDVVGFTVAYNTLGFGIS